MLLLHVSVVHFRNSSCIIIFLDMEKDIYNKHQVYIVFLDLTM